MEKEMRKEVGRKTRIRWRRRRRRIGSVLV